MHPQATMNIALQLSAIGVIDRENAQICDVSIGAIRHWRAGRRRASSGTTASKTNTCPRCHSRPLDEPAYAYLLGLYLGDGHITHGPRDVYALAIACSDDWPGLMDAAQQALAAAMPTSSVCRVQQHDARWSRATQSTGRACSRSTGRDASTFGKSSCASG